MISTGGQHVAAAPRTADSAARPPWLAAYPRAVAWDMPLPPTTLPAQFDRSVAAYGPRPCLTFSGRTITYAEVGHLVAKYAAGLAHIGVGPGTHVGLFLPNTPTYLIAYFAVLKLGAVVVNFNPLQPLEDIAAQVADSGTTLMITLDLAGVFDKVEALLLAGSLPRAVVASFQALLPGSRSVLFKLFQSKQLAHPTSSPVADKLVLEGRLLANDGTFLAPVLEAADLAVLQYTGGTTGAPKAAMLSHANLTVNVQQLSAWTAGLVQPGAERILAVLPFFHIFALTGIVNFGIALGAEIVIQPRFQLDETLQLIARARPTLLIGVPTLFAAIVGHKDAPNLAKPGLAKSSLKVCLSGGAALPRDVATAFTALTGAPLVEAYGLSETAPGVTCNPLDRRAKVGSSGLPLPGTTVSVRDVTMPEREMPLGQAGELCVRGPQVMTGYWNRPDATRAAFVGDVFRTGDIGYMDQDGYVFVVDRSHDVIVAAGFKVYPRHVEEKIYEHAAVEEVTVIGIPDAQRGAVPKAFIKLKAGRTASADDIRSHLEPRLTKIQMPVEIEFRAALPKTVIGKLSKKELRAN